MSDSPRDAKRQKMMDPQSSQSPIADKYKNINANIMEDDVLSSFRGYHGNDLPYSYYQILLSVIASYSEGLLHDDFKRIVTAADILSTRADLQDKLAMAWKNKSFEEILNLDYLRSVVPSKPQFLLPDGELQLISKATEAAWRVPYVGTCHELLLKNINCMKGQEPYENICAIVQSSGTGKSRMVHEMANLVFTFPMNIRTTEGIAFTYPPSDESLHNFLVQSVTNDNPKRCMLRYTEFFGSLFSCAAEELNEEFGELPNQQKQLSEGEFASRWRTRITEPERRRKFYEAVVDSCPLGQGDPTDDILNTSMDSARRSLDTLIASLNARCETTGEVKIVVYIDEAHELSRKILRDVTPFSQLDVLSSVLANLNKRPLFCIFLSTQSSLRSLVPPANAVPSERARAHGARLLAPITETPFDCSPDLKIVPDTLHIENLSVYSYLAKWGRPLWWTRLNDAVSNERRDELGKELVSFARVKLIQHHNLDIMFEKSLQIMRLAVLDVLLALDFQPGRSRVLQEEMVKGHMRMAYSVPQHREYFRSGYSSEPILAEAAAQQMHNFQKHFKGDVMINILSDRLNTTLIDLGQRGEVVMRALLMRAYMNSILADSKQGSTPNFSRGCLLNTFVEQLFNSKVADKILASHADNIKFATNFRDTFANAAVRFTHFVKAEDDIMVSTHALFAAFARGMAFVCYQTQECVDIVIPVLLDKKDTLKEANMSAILIQVKRRVQVAGPMKYSFTQEDVRLFPALEEDKQSGRPYIVMIAELGGQWKETKEKARQGNEEACSDATAQTIYISRLPERQYHPSCETHPRFYLTAYDCSPRIYRPIREADHEAYQELLATRDLLMEHPRQDKESLSMVRKQKLVWGQGPDYFHWVEDEVLNRKK